MPQLTRHHMHVGTSSIPTSKRHRVHVTPYHTQRHASPHASHVPSHADHVSSQAGHMLQTHVTCHHMHVTAHGIARNDDVTPDDRHTPHVAERSSHVITRTTSVPTHMPHAIGCLNLRPAARRRGPGTCDSQANNDLARYHAAQKPLPLIVATPGDTNA